MHILQYSSFYIKSLFYFCRLPLNLPYLFLDDAHNFEKKSRNEIDIEGVDYDPSSIMHYGRQSFSINGKDTIVPINNVDIGQRDHLSAKDIVELNLLYSCQSRKDYDFVSGLFFTLPIFQCNVYFFFNFQMAIFLNKKAKL